MLIQEKARRQRDKNRFIMSKETQDEFNIKPNEVPLAMREVLDPSIRYTDHVNQNIRVVKCLNDVSKVVYLSKIKFNIENQLHQK